MMRDMIKRDVMTRDMKKRGLVFLAIAVSHHATPRHAVSRHAASCHASSDLPAGADGFDRLAREALVRFPVGARDADPADALAFDDDRIAAFHRGPAVGTRSQRESQRARRVQYLAGGALHGGRALVRRRADGLGGGGVQSVEAAAVHAL